MRGASTCSASPSEPGPLGASVVTRTITPPRPPGVFAAHPSAVGNAFTDAAGATGGCSEESAERGAAQPETAPTTSASADASSIERARAVMASAFSIP